MWLKAIIIISALSEWSTDIALRVVKKIEDVDGFYLEQPCQTYDQCLFLRNRCNLPIILDECVTDLKVHRLFTHDYVEYFRKASSSKIKGIRG